VISFNKGFKVKF